MLHLMASTFTNSTTVIAELLQNSRRAGATSIDIQLEGDRLVVSDNGCGIADMGTLLAIAKSDWNGEVKDSESPFGAGFLSAIFACRTITVTSRGSRLTANTADILDLAPASIEPVPEDGRTTVVLEGHSIPNPELAIARYTLGFPIPVAVNGVDQRRPHADNSQNTYINLPIGRLSSDALKVWGGFPALYLQGSPINSKPTFCQEQGHLHLDTRLFKGRMPDRADLIDADTAVAKIRSAIYSATVSFLLSELENLGAEVFFKHHRTLLDAIILGYQAFPRDAEGRSKLKSLEAALNALDVMPSHWLGVLHQAPTSRMEYATRNNDFQFRRPAESTVHRDAIAQGVYCVSNRAGGNLAWANAAFFSGTHILLAPVSWHWSAQHSFPAPESPDVQATGIIGTDQLTIDGLKVELVVATNIEITAIGGRRVAIPYHYDEIEDRLYVTPEADNYNSVLQCPPFEQDDDGNDNSAEIAQAVALCRTLKQQAINPDLPALLAHFLPDTLPTKLAGKRFEIEIDLHGCPSIRLA